MNSELNTILFLRRFIVVVWNIQHTQSSYQDSGEEQGAYNDVGSFPKDFGYIPFDGNECAEAASTSQSDEQKPRILLMGLRRYTASLIYLFIYFITK